MCRPKAHRQCPGTQIACGNGRGGGVTTLGGGGATGANTGGGGSGSAPRTAGGGGGSRTRSSGGGGGSRRAQAAMTLAVITAASTITVHLGGLEISNRGLAMTCVYPLFPTACLESVAAVHYAPSARRVQLLGVVVGEGRRIVFGQRWRPFSGSGPMSAFANLDRADRWPGLRSDVSSVRGLWPRRPNRATPHGPATSLLRNARHRYCCRWAGGRSGGTRRMAACRASQAAA